MIRITAPSMIFGVGIGLLGCLPQVKSPNSSYDTLLDRTHQTSHQGRTLKIPNLRASRNPLFDWNVRSKTMTVRVHQAEPLKIASRRAKWRLKVTADLDSKSGSFVSVKSPTPGVKLLSARHSGHKYEIELEVVAPTMCPLRKGDQKVELVFDIESSSGRKQLSTVVDDQCLVGEIVDSLDLEPLARLAEKHAFDPVIDQLLDKAAPYPVSDVNAEVKRLLKWVNFSRKLVLEDPPAIVGSWFGTAYILSPTQTLRLGGDCEDWSLLVSGFLARRGYQTSLLYGAGHVWVRVRTDQKPNSYVDIDLLIPVEAGRHPLEVTLAVK
ncbi:MAG: hypothetical protein ABH871_09240 [Pseudomonadota bacterium]